MLDANITQQLASALTLLRGPIELRLRLDGSEPSRELASLASEVAALSELISIGEPLPADPSFTPELAVAPLGAPPRASFLGLPMGHEFTSLILALLQAGGHPSKADPADIARIGAISRPVVLETFFSLSCHNCPDVVQALNLMAALNPHVVHKAIDGGLFPAEIERRGIMGVPAVFADGAQFHSGRASLSELLDKIEALHGAQPSAPKPLPELGTLDALIVGGGPAGATAALYAARKGLKVAMLAERMGGQTQDTLGIENYASVLYTEGPKFAADLEAHAKSAGAVLLPGRRASKIERDNPDSPLRVELSDGQAILAKTLILAPGARWREMGVPGESRYKTKGVAFCPHCDGPLFKGKAVAVVGGGNSGVEAAIDLAGLASRVVLIEFAPELKADAVLQARLKALPNCEIVLNSKTTEVLGDGTKASGLAIEDRSSGASRFIPAEGIFVQIGLLPNTDWLKGAIELTERGEIAVDAMGATSMPGVFAAGDATWTPFKQIVISAGEGAKAALSAFDHLIRH